MKSSVFLTLMALIFVKFTNAQNDTVYHYYTKEYREVSKDSSFSIMKLYKRDNFWYGLEVYARTNKVKSEGRYSDKDGKTPLGSFKNYFENGVLDNIAEYENGKNLSRTYYHKNGNKKSWITYNDKGADQQKGWDETGKEIRNFIVEREARFKGGPSAWQKYLEKNLNAQVASDAGAPVGKYEVKVQFAVSKAGYISNVKAVSIPAACKPCASEAVSVILTGPQWEPAIQHNEPVLYQAIQYITFEVAEEKGRKKN